MLHYSQKALEFVRDMSEDRFSEDEKTQFAVVRAIEVIGEAAKSVPAEVQALAPEIPWRQITRTRDRIVHHYFGVRLEIVWNVTQRDLPKLVLELELLLDRLKDHPSSS